MRIAKSIQAALMALLVAGAGLLVNAKAQSSSSPVYIDHQKVEGSFQHALPIPDLYAGQSGGGHYRVRASRHDTPTEVEIHTADTDIFYVTSGTAKESSPAAIALTRRSRRRANSEANRSGVPPLISCSPGI